MEKGESDFANKPIILINSRRPKNVPDFIFIEGSTRFEEIMFSRLRALTVAFVFLLGLLAGAGTAVSFEPVDIPSCNEQSVSVSAADACGKAMIHTSCLYHGTCGLFLSPDPARILSRSTPSARNIPLTTPLAGQPSAPETPPPISIL